METVRANGVDIARDVQAATMYAINQLLDKDGATLCPVNMAMTEAVRLLSLPSGEVFEATARLINTGKLSGLKHIQSVAISQDFENEKIIMEYARCQN